MLSGRLGPLGDRRFRWLLIGQTCTSFAVYALFLGLSVWVKAMTGSSALPGASCSPLACRPCSRRSSGTWPTGCTAGP